MYLYLDLIWLLNFCIDYLLLWMTALLRKTPFKKWRLVVASAIGSGYVLFLFMPSLQPLYTFVVKMLLAFLIVGVAFGYGTLQRFLARFFTFYFVSFVTGGGLLAVHFFLQSQHGLLAGMVATQGSGYGDMISWWFVILGFPLMFWFSHSRWNQVQKNQSTANVLVDLSLYVGEEVVSCRGLIDTGNRLSDPLTKTPVIMVEASVLNKIVPQHLLEMIQDMHSVGNIEQSALPDEWLSRIRVVPYRGIRQRMELMVTFKPDRMEISKKGDIWVPDKVFVGINTHSLSTEGTFQAIIHPDLLQNEYKIEKYSNKEAM